MTDATQGLPFHLNLWPLSQGELRDHRETFIDALFEARFPRVTGAPIGRSATAATLATGGGYPERQGRSHRGRSRFFASYVASIIGRDLGDVASVRNIESVERLLFTIAARSGGIASFHGMATDLDLDTSTIRAHTKILEDLFLVRQLGPWHVHLGSRQVKSSKLNIVHTGLLAYLIGANERRVIWNVTTVPSPVWKSRPARPQPPATFAGLRSLRDKLGARFRTGVVLHT